ncbi:MAG: hypothetical protein ED559_04205 [Phycisphaera sp.]|nr:MAG: hypothetical protein ED559_04205 [Phycisphaera sp.]
MKKYIMSIAFASLWVPSALGDILTVPAQYPTIAAATAAAGNGDIVVVSPGTYVENISVFGKDITILAAGSPADTFIDGNVSQDVGELEGFTVLGTLRFATDLQVTDCIFDGGGVDVENCVIDFSNTVIRNCTETAVVSFLSGLTFTNCQFENNSDGVVRPFDGTATFFGCSFVGNAGGAVRGDNLQFVSCQFVGNTNTSGPAAIQSTSEFASCSIDSCDFFSNSSGGLAAAIYIWNDNEGVPVGAISGCAFENNTAGAGGGAIRLSLLPDPPVMISNTAFCGNSPSDIVGVANLGSGNTFEAQCDCLADVNGDGSVTPADFTAWINAFNNNLPECDQNSDGSCTPADFTAWIANFNIGC